MPSLLPILVYPPLCAYAVWVLWGCSETNGLFHAIRKTVQSGSFPDGTPLIQKYTGHEEADEWFRTLVTFFFPVTWKSNDGTIEQVQNIFAGIIVGLAGMLADAYRPKSNFLLWWPSVWGLAYQLIGGGIILPIYSLVSAYFPPSGQPSAKAAAAIPYSILVGAILPAFISLTPGILPRDENTHQIILAIWQPFPAYASLVQAFLVYTPLSAMVPKPKNVSKYLGNVFATLAVAAGALHFATSIYYRGDLWDMYVPHFGDVGLYDGTKNFLKWDHLCIHIALLGYAAVKGRSFWVAGLMPVIGPGAVIGWWLAEAEFAAEGKGLGSGVAGKGKGKKGKKDVASQT